MTMEILKGKSAIKILGISGSGRKRSYNSALLEAAKELAPDNVAIEICDVSHFPLYSQDIEFQAPVRVQEFKERIRKADAILFASPEYNFSVTAVMKNAIEWGNRPDNLWDGKPSAIASASSSSRGGARSQLHLRQIMVDLNMHPINEPQLLIARASEKFDSNLKLTDEVSRETLRSQLIALAEWTLKIKPELAKSSP